MGTTEDTDLARRARQRVADAWHDNATHLDLSGLKLTKLPPLVAHLTDLRALRLDDNRLTALPDFIGGLTNLNELTLNNNGITHLPETIGGLRDLQLLDLARNRLTTLPHWIDRLVDLEILHLSHNELRELPDSLGNVRSLRFLRVDGNRLTSLPESFGNLPKLRLLVLDDNPLPPEMLAAAEQGTSGVLRLLKLHSVDDQVVREAKLLFVGEGTVGKSSLLAAFRDEEFVEGRDTTHGIETASLHVAHEDKTYTLNTWDFGGQEVYRSTHQFFFTAPAVYLLLWNPRLGHEAGRISEWLKLIRQRAGTEARVHIVATHCGPTDHQGSLDQHELAGEFGDILVGFHRIDSKTGHNVDALLRQVAATVAALPHVERTLPTAWWSLQQRLQDSGKAYIEYSEYQRLAAEYELDEAGAQALATVATTLGHWRYYPDEVGLSDLVVLKGD